ncbi:divalent cation transport-related protein [Encephalitozoon hellem]|uniref:Divalent cation transport-related protein n=2 Tax=Encephalitozoon hellem TaxID=27973 RepID=A0A9Q9CC71_ENCHE|nr:divalent cation transport-related protein [Encephalitozoon hellem]
MLSGTSLVHVLSPEKGYIVKRAFPSNTFIVKRGTKYIKIDHILELVENPVDLEKIYSFVPPSSIWNLLPPVDLKNHFFLGDTQVRFVEKELKLLKLDGGHTRISYKDIADVVCYMSSIKECDDFHLRMDIYPQIIKEWALENFSGDSIEIGLYCLLACDEEGDMASFLKRWRDSSLEETNVEDLIHRINTTFIIQEKKIRIQQYLNKLIG